MSFRYEWILLFGGLAFTACQAAVSANGPEIQERASAMTLADAVEVIRPAILQIAFDAQDFPDEAKAHIPRRSQRITLGTAFFINSDAYVITANHVIQLGLRLVADSPAKRKDLFVGIAQPLTEHFRGNFTGVGFDLIDSDPRHDLALLKLKKNPFTGELRSGMVIGGKEIPLAVRTTTPLLQRPKDGEAIGVSGYPLANPVLVTKGGWMATSWAYDFDLIETQGVPPGFPRLDMADVYLADIDINPGNSGGPVYSTDNAKIIGVAVATQQTRVDVRDDQNKQVTTELLLQYSSGIALVVPSEYIINLLEKHGLKWQQ